MPLDNTEIAEVFFQRISGEHVEEVVVRDGPKKGQTEKQTRYGASDVLAEFANSPEQRHTIQIDSRLLDRLDVAEGSTRDKAAQELRAIVNSVGKTGMPGEHVRCVVSVSMLTEGWDASNVTHILGVRAFESQLLCEQVVGRGLRRMNYTPDPANGRLPAEYVDVYGIPFSLIPFKGRPKDEEAPEDKPRNHVYAVPERVAFEMKFPSVEAYVYRLQAAGIRCDVDSLDPIVVNEEPTAVYLKPTRGYHDEPAVLKPQADFVKQDRSTYYATVHFQQILFRLAQLILDALVRGAEAGEKDRAWVRLQARHRLFPEIYRIVREYVDRKVTFGPGVDRRELGLEIYANVLVAQLRDHILPAGAAEEASLLPVTNSFRPYYSTKGVDYSTIRPTVPLVKSHLNAGVVYSAPERWAIDVLDDPRYDFIECFTPNDGRIGLKIPYEYQDDDHEYIPDFMIRFKGGKTLLLEVKGGKGQIHDPNAVSAKNAAARKWVSAVNNHGGFGQWVFDMCIQATGENAASYQARLLEMLARHAAVELRLPFRRVEARPEDRFVRALPLVSLRPAAGGFSEEQAQPELPLESAENWVEIASLHQLAKGMFVAQVRGKSMEPAIPDGAYCLFGPAPQGSRNGLRVLVMDPGGAPGGGHYTVKVYESEKTFDAEGGFEHERIVLKPLNPDFPPLVLSPTEERFRVVGVFVALLGLPRFESTSAPSS